MTVQELIQALQALPQHLEVVGQQVDYEGETSYAHVHRVVPIRISYFEHPDCLPSDPAMSWCSWLPPDTPGVTETREYVDMIQVHLF